ncbi:uncharacterized protein LOC115837274 [Nomascus leucogenys]|uniref:uncharacterized protein LOC115837274 n=1 Tax=Nomascus leucogenys TaxID=61853 RepID=UPI00122D9A48|nr:uncharacterized protein LOC115837274 [Nomascus leucogenys]
MPDSAGSRGPGLAEGPRAGGGAVARAGGPPSPALAGAQPQGHVDCLRRKPALGEGKAGSVLPLQGEPPLRAGGRRRRSRPPLAASLREGRRRQTAGTGLEAPRLCEVAVVASSAPPRCAQFLNPEQTEIQTAEAAAAAPSAGPRWG